MPILSWNALGREQANRGELAHEDRVLSLRSSQSIVSANPALAGPAQAGIGGRRSPWSSLTQTCANPGCASGWMHLWRSRTQPIFEGGWSCSPTCTRERVHEAIRREMDAWGSAPEAHRHRIPLGLVMLEQGWITAAQLRKAVEAQRSAGSGRLGYWLVTQTGVSERLVTRALGLQWSCPVLPLEFHDAEGMTSLLPRLFLDAFGALPLRVAAGKLLYLGFEDRLDTVLALAVERMSGLRVESGLVEESLFRPAYARLLDSNFPPVELVEAASESVMAQVLARAIERTQPMEARLVRVHDCFWLRMWRSARSVAVPERSAVEDVICSIRSQSSW